MFDYPNERIIQRLRETYLPGTRVELMRMEDPAAPPIGTQGTVVDVDDIGSILVNWDNAPLFSL